MSEHETGECGGKDTCYECLALEIAALEKRLALAQAVADAGVYYEREGRLISGQGWMEFARALEAWRDFKKYEKLRRAHEEKKG